MVLLHLGPDSRSFACECPVVLNWVIQRWSPSKVSTEYIIRYETVLPVLYNMCQVQIFSFRGSGFC